MGGSGRGGHCEGIRRVDGDPQRIIRGDRGGGGGVRGGTRSGSRGGGTGGIVKGGDRGGHWRVRKD